MYHDVSCKLIHGLIKLRHLLPDVLNWCIYHGPRRERSPGRLAEFDLVITMY
ncbi:hypothetical protein BDD12DRAFT_839889, partial [Trichophaea hybrida]